MCSPRIESSLINHLTMVPHGVLNATTNQNGRVHHNAATWPQRLPRQRTIKLGGKFVAAEGLVVCLSVFDM